MGKKKLSIEILQKKAKVHGGKCLSKKYINKETKYKWICSEGHIWWAVPSFYRKSWCLKCAGKEIKTIEATYLDNGTKYKVLEYIENIGQEYQKADLVIARSGAMTVSEIAALGKPSILLPLPWATDNHQYYNAFYLKELGAAEIVESKIDNAKILSKLISDLAQDKERRLQMGHNAKDAFKSSSSIEIYKFILFNISFKTFPKSRN